MLENGAIFRTRIQRRLRKTMARTLDNLSSWKFPPNNLESKTFANTSWTVFPNTGSFQMPIDLCFHLIHIMHISN